MSDDDVTARLKRHAEGRCGGTAELDRVVPVPEQMEDGDSFWEAQVHVFRMTGAGRVNVCYAWMQPAPDRDGEVPVAVPQSADVPDPQAAVEAEIRREVEEPADGPPPADA